MTTTVTIRDESTSGKTLNQIQFEIPNERITVKELIRSRVFQEVKDSNTKLTQQASSSAEGFVRSAEETKLNGTLGPEMIDWRRQFTRAIDAYRRGQILIFVDDQQTDWLDDELTLNSQTKISFLRLAVLTGG